MKTYIEVYMHNIVAPRSAVSIYGTRKVIDACGQSSGIQLKRIVNIIARRSIVPTSLSKALILSIPTTCVRQ